MSSPVHASQDRLENGVVYTPQNLAEYVAQKTAESFLADNTQSEISIIDPACGKGILLESLWEELGQQEVDGVSIYGVDIDADTVEICQDNLEKTTDLSYKNLDVLSTNALCPFNQNREAGLEELKKKFSQPSGFDMMIANPPWGADVSEYRDKLEGHYETLNGQFDVYTLFLENALSLVRNGGYFGFIVPDSILNHGKNEIREILLNRTQIKFIARLGEQIFPDINRDTVVLVAKNAEPVHNCKTDCFRLDKELRDQILDGSLTFHEAEQGNTHKVRQNRFLENENYKLDIDLRESEHRTFHKLKSGLDSFGDYLNNSRGVELSQSGEIAQCNRCGLWVPKPKSQKSNCKHCDQTINLAKVKTKKIVADSPDENSKPLIQGSDISRYESSPSKYIELGFPGIKYKDRSLYNGEKILVRKTGVGVSANLDYSGAYTTQVVYLFQLKGTAPDFLTLEPLIALLNSRAYYFYLTKETGENQWKSHPYLTQTQILNLPLPDIEENRETFKEINELVRPYLKEGEELPDDVDAQVEYLVGQMYDLSREDYEIIYDTIKSSQDLEAIDALKNIRVSDIFER